MRKILTLAIISLLLISTLSILTPQIKAEGTSSSNDTQSTSQPVLVRELIISGRARVVDYNDGIYVVGTSNGDLYVINEAGEYTLTHLGDFMISDVRIKGLYIAIALNHISDEGEYWYDTHHYRYAYFDYGYVIKFTLTDLTPIEQWRTRIEGWGYWSEESWDGISNTYQNFALPSVDLSSDGNYVAYLSHSNVGVLRGSDGTSIASYSISGAYIVSWLDATNDMEYIAITAEVGPYYGGENTGVELYRFDGTSLNRVWGTILIYRYETTEVRISENKKYVAVATSSGTEMNLLDFSTGNILWTYDARQEQFAVDGDQNLNYIIGATQYDPWVSPSPPYKWFIIHNLGTTYKVLAEGNMNGPINDLDSNDDASLFAFGSDAGEVILLRRTDSAVKTVYSFNIERLIDSIEVGTNTFVIGGENFINLYIHEFPRFPVDNPLEGSYWYHCPGSGEEYAYIPGHRRFGHFPSGGVRGADDTYALDLNWGPERDSDLGKPVYAIEKGVIKQLVRTLGWVLIEHKTPLYWKGRIYGTWYSGYLHMQNIPKNLKEGVLVEKSTKIGEVGSTMARSPHLHFAIYVGRIVDPSEPGFDRYRQNAFLESVDPGQVGGPEYAKYIYGDLETMYEWGRGAIYNHNVDEIVAQDSKHWFEKGGSDSDWFESTSYGFYGHMFYTHTNIVSVDNWGRWNHEILADGKYKIYVFIPRNYADTTSAVYQVFRNGNLIKKIIVDLGIKYVKHDEWVWLGDFDFKAGDKIQVFLGDDTGEWNRLVAYDTVKIWAKQDLKLPRD